VLEASSLHEMSVVQYLDRNPEMDPHHKSFRFAISRVFLLKLEEIRNFKNESCHSIISPKHVEGTAITIQGKQGVLGPK